MRATVTARPLTDDALRLARCMLENGNPDARAYISQLEAAEATTWRCSCRCASVNFKVPGTPEAPAGVHILGDFVFGAEADLAGESNWPPTFGLPSSPIAYAGTPSEPSAIRLTSPSSTMTKPRR